MPPARSSLLDDDDIYGTIERKMHGLSMGHDADKYPKTVAFDPVVKEESVKKFRKTRNRKKKKKSASEERHKNSFGNLMPSNLLSKKSKQTQKHSDKESRGFEDISSPGSSYSSGTCASVDDVIATLQKLMNRDGVSSDPNHRALKDFLHEQVVADQPLKPSQDTNVSSKSFSQALENRLETSYLEPESSNSNDDLTSISSTTTDSSSQEYSYVLQPNLMKKRNRFQAPLKHPIRDSTTVTNIDAMLHKLSGEDGYMVLSGRNHVRGSLDKVQLNKDNNQYTVDTTYDNVNKLMAAYREAAAKDAGRVGAETRRLKDSVKPTVGSKYLSKPNADRVKQSCVVSSSSSTETTPFSAHSSMKSFKIPDDATAATTASPRISLRSCHGTASNNGKAPPSNLQTNNDRSTLIKPDLHNPRDWLTCRETDIVDSGEHGHVTTTHRRGFDLGRISQVLCSSSNLSLTAFILTSIFGVFLLYLPSLFPSFPGGIYG